MAAEKANKERTLATRYHKVKFFGVCSGPWTFWHVYDQVLDRQKLLRKIKQTKSPLVEDGVSSKARRALEAELFELRVDLNYVLVRLSNSCAGCSRYYCALLQNYPRLEKYISLFPPDARQTEGTATPVHSVGSSSATDDKRETLREWVRGQMLVGEMTGAPETLERKQRAQQNPAESWQSTIGRKTKNVQTEGKGKGKTMHESEVLDDFFEGDDSGANEGTEAEEAEERDNVLPVPVEVPTKRRWDKSATRLDKDSEPAERHSKKPKPKKHRGQATTPSPIVQDRFFGDDQSE